MSVFKRGLFIFKSYVNPLLDRYEKHWRSEDGKGKDGDDLRDDAMKELDEEYEASRRNRKGRGPQGNRPGARRAASGQDETLARCWANLELPYGADLSQVKKAWRRLMKKYHPDRFIDDASKKKVATELAQKITQSYETLERHLLAEKKRKGA